MSKMKDVTVKAYYDMKKNEMFAVTVGEYGCVVDKGDEITILNYPEMVMRLNRYLKSKEVIEIKGLGLDL